MNNFILFCGLPCSGKSTFLEAYQKPLMDVYGIQCVISSDAVVDDVAVARGLTYSEVFKDAAPLAGKYIEAMLGILSLQQRNFILDQTNVTKKTRERKLSLLTHPQNYEKIAVVFNTPIETIQERFLERNKGGKIIPQEVMDNMNKGLTIPTVEEGFNKVLTVEQFTATLNTTYSSGMKFA